MKNGQEITYTISWSEDNEQRTAIVSNYDNVERIAHLDNGDKMAMHHASPPHIVGEPYGKVVVTDER